MHKHAKLEGFGGMLPQEMRCSEIALGPFWDGSRAVVATWVREYRIHFLAVHVHLKLFTWNMSFHRSGVNKQLTRVFRACQNLHSCNQICLDNGFLNSSDTSGVFPNGRELNT